VGLGVRVAERPGGEGSDWRTTRRSRCAVRHLGRGLDVPVGSAFMGFLRWRKRATASVAGLNQTMNSVFRVVGPPPGAPMLELLPPMAHLAVGAGLRRAGQRLAWALGRAPGSGRSLRCRGPHRVLHLGHRGHRGQQPAFRATSSGIGPRAHRRHRGTTRGVDVTADPTPRSRMTQGLI